MPYLGALFGQPIRVVIPAELTDEAALLAYLGLGAAELRKIWYYRRRMYRHFSIAKGSKKVRMISAPDERLKFLQRKLASLARQAALKGTTRPWRSAGLLSLARLTDSCLVCSSC